MTPATLGDLAVNLQRPHETVDNALARIKNWSKEGVIKADIQNPGSGRARTFSQKQVKRAAVVEMMARLGMRVCGGAAARFIDSAMQKSEVREALQVLLQHYEE